MSSLNGAGTLYVVQQRHAFAQAMMHCTRAFQASGAVVTSDCGNGRDGDAQRNGRWWGASGDHLG